MIFKARTLSLPLLLAALSLCVPSAAARTQGPPGPAAPKWREFTSAEGGFTVSMPAEPKVATSKLPPPNESVTLRTHIAETEAEYGVAYADYPSQIEGTETVGPFLAAVRDGGVKGVGGRLLEDAEAYFDGHPGRVYRYEFAGGYQVRCRVLVVGRRLYVVTASTYGSKAPNEAVRRSSEALAERFMQSFRLHAVEGGPKPPYRIGDPVGGTMLPEGEVDKLMRTLPEGSVLKGFCAAKFCRRLAGAEYEFKVLKNPAPEYSGTAKAVRASGQVLVVILADEEGRVVAAQAETGHPLLRPSAEAAARKMLVSPVKSKDGKPSKFTGVVVYTFVVR